MIKIETKYLKKITLNLSVISNVLIGSVILTGNYKFEPKVIALTTACIASNYAHIKLKKNTKKTSNF